MGGVLRRFPFSKALKPAWHSVTKGGRTAAQIGGVPPVLLRQVLRGRGFLNSLHTGQHPSASKSHEPLRLLRFVEPEGFCRAPYRAILRYYLCDTPYFVPVAPQSEIRVKFLVCQSEKTGEKCGEILAKFFADFRPSFSRETGRRKFHTNSSTHQDLKFHTPWTKILSPRDSGSWGAQRIARNFLREISSPPKWCDTPPWH